MVSTSRERETRKRNRGEEMTAPIIDEQVSKQDEEKVQALAEIEQTIMQMEVLFLKTKVNYQPFSK